MNRCARRSCRADLGEPDHRVPAVAVRDRAVLASIGTVGRGGQAGSVDIVGAEPLEAVPEEVLDRDRPRIGAVREPSGPRRRSQNNGQLDLVAATGDRLADEHLVPPAWWRITGVGSVMPCSTAAA
ncbi:MAG: hypothetical protein WKG01_23980 [Kofleriaceae bacterium]